MSGKNPKRVPFKLPYTVCGATDAGKLLQELEALDDFLYQANLRKPGTPISPPKTSLSLDKLFELNKQSTLDERMRKNMIEILRKLKLRAPQIHISFASEPSKHFIEEIVRWARANIHSYLMVNVGIQPSIIVGCSVRTTNRVFDMSLKNRFKNSREILKRKLGEGQ